MSDDDAPTPFHDPDAYLAIPRVGAFDLSPDGQRIVATVAGLSPDRKRSVSALWELDAKGAAPARQLTRSAKGEQAPVFRCDGVVLFTSARPDTDAETTSDDDPPALWLLPDRGEARVVATRPGGISGPVCAWASPAVVVSSATLPGAETAKDDEERRKARKDRKVAAILHQQYPIRYWDHDLGPDEPRLLVAHAEDPAADERLELTDLTPAPGRRFDEADVSVSPDGSTVYATSSVAERGGVRSTLVAIDVSSGEERTVLAEDGVEFGGAAIDPAGRRAIVLRAVDGTPTEPPRRSILLLDLETDQTTTIAPDWDRWPSGFRWIPGEDAVVCVADEDGAAPVFRIDLPSGPDADAEITRLTTDHGAHGNLRVAPDGSSVYALRAAVDAPPTIVRLDARTPGESVAVPGPDGATPEVPGRLEEVRTTADDGTPLRGWLVLPEDASADTPAPLLLWIHGGPLSSWNAWSWRWNPWLAVARGWAVLLPDPALSTGYGLDFIRRGWGRWGAEPYTDVLAVTDAAETRPDVDETRTAAMGGSFGGYMANWVAGHTDRFDAIVTHASLWALPSFGATTDRADHWRKELSGMAEEWSPHRFVEHMTTPMLVIHGDKDYRVPVGEALQLFSELAWHHGDTDGSMAHKLLYFPDENHWILQPQHARLWYETVFAFLDHHVLGQEWVMPDLLR